MRSRGIWATAMLVGVLLMVPWEEMNPSGNGQTGKADSAGPEEVKFCDLVRNPSLYDGKAVSVRASYMNGFESDEIFCLSCRDPKTKTWVEFVAEEDWKGPRREISKLPKNPPGGISNAKFVGTFHASKGHYGHFGAYRFLFVVTGLSAVEVVYAGPKPPHLLPPKIREKMCQ